MMLLQGPSAPANGASPRGLQGILLFPEVFSTSTFFCLNHSLSQEASENLHINANDRVKFPVVPRLAPLSSEPENPSKIIFTGGACRLLRGKDLQSQLGCPHWPKLAHAAAMAGQSHAARVVVASMNPVKIGAAEVAFRKSFPKILFTFEGLESESGVREQPMTDEETFRGARNRAQFAQQRIQEADYVVAIEGGVEWCHLAGEPQLMCFAWAVVLSRELDVEGRARTGAFMLPPPIADLIKGGMELGHADDQVFGRTNSKRQNGSVGLLTRDQINRQLYYEHAISLALIPFLNSRLYSSPSTPALPPGTPVEHARAQP